MRYFLLIACTFALVLTACGSSEPGLDIKNEDVADVPGDVIVNDDVAVDQGIRHDVVDTDPGLTDLIPVDLIDLDQGIEDPGQNPDVIPPLDVRQDILIEDISVEDIIVEDTTFDAEIPPECLIDDDCIGYGEPTDCLYWGCDVEKGLCIEIIVEDGTACADGDFCTGPDTCQSGTCRPGPAITCDDGDLCTTDECLVTGCVNTRDTTVLTCGTGLCYREIARCVAGVINTCVAGMSAAEQCDGLDNDCDGSTDNNISGLGNVCLTGLSGPCSPGTIACQNGTLLCIGNVQPKEEKCDRIDNDCNGVTDNDVITNGQGCITSKVGVCSVGETGCANGLINCIQTVFPSAERCDGVDNDCDDSVDEDNPGSGLPCMTGLPGVCGEGETACSNGAITCIQTGFPSGEVCDGVDNDCDGVIDPPNSTGCLSFLKDADSDGYGLTGDTRCLCSATAPYTATQGGDCCDTDSRAKPTGTTPYTTMNACSSFDYNCDGSVSLQYNYSSGSCGGWPISCGEVVQGWVGAAPACGAAGQILTTCQVDWTSCSMTGITDVVQGCY